MTPLAKHLASHLGGRSHAEIAAALDVNRQSVVAWMHGHSIPSRGNLIRLADALSMSDVALDTAIVLAEREIAERAIERWREP